MLLAVRVRAATLNDLRAAEYRGYINDTLSHLYVTLTTRTSSTHMLMYRPV